MSVLASLALVPSFVDCADNLDHCTFETVEQLVDVVVKGFGRPSSSVLSISKGWLSKSRHPNHTL
jgi:hypothetical protein